MEADPLRPVAIAKDVGAVVALAVAILVFGSQHTSLDSQRQTCRTKLAQLVDMQEDARRIEILREVPRRATDRQLPHEQLAAEIEKACQRASILPATLASVWPEAPLRIEHTEYMGLNTRLSFEGIELSKLVVFTHHLRNIDASLTIDAVRITARKQDSRAWNAELTVTYLLYAPRGART